MVRPRLPRLMRCAQRSLLHDAANRCAPGRSAIDALDLPPVLCTVVNLLEVNEFSGLPNFDQCWKIPNHRNVNFRTFCEKT